MTRAFSFTFNPDSQEIGPVTVRSRIRREDGEILALRPDFEAEVVPGTGWERHVAISGRQLIDQRKAARFEAALQKPLTLAQCQALLMQKVPVPVRITLVPDIQVPAPGIPVPVQAPASPRTETISVGIPDIIPARIELLTDEAGPGPSGYPGCRLRARVIFPSFLLPTQDEAETVARTVLFTEVSGQSAVSPGNVTRDPDGWVAKDYTALTDASVMEGAQVMVRVSARVCGITIEALAKLSFAPQKIYQPYIVPRSISVRKEHPASFSATLRSVDSGGNETEVPEAVISISVPPDAQGILTLSPYTATGTLQATAGTSETGKDLTVTFTVLFAVGKDRYEDQLRVQIGTGEPGILEVVFDPAEKTTLNPFAGSDTVTLKARVRSNDGKEETPAPPVITFSRATDAVWLDDPSTPVAFPGGWMAAAIGASPPDPGSRAAPPGSEIIIVRATEGSRTIAEAQVPVSLAALPVLDILPDTIRLLSREEGSSGTTSARAEDTVTLFIPGGSPGTWTFDLAPEAGSSPPLTISPAGNEPAKASFTISLATGSRPPAPATGPAGWQQLYRLRSRATSGSLSIEGPDLRVIVLREGLFVEKIFAVNERNEYRTSSDLATLPIRVDTPDTDRRRTARVKLVAMIWNGTDLVQDPGAVKGDQVSWGEPVCTAGDCIKWETIFSVLKARLVCTDSDEPALTPYTDLAGTWGISIDRIIPGGGEELDGEVEASASAGTVRVPLRLILGTRSDGKTQAVADEKARCIRIINGCIPLRYRQKLLDDLELLPAKGAKDYQVYSRAVYETAWKIWAEDQKDYEYWENGWGYYILGGAEVAKGAGDIAFALLIGYATSSMGPAFSYGASTMATEFKDQGLECYAYYVAHSGEKDFRTCVIDYVHENIHKFILKLSSGAVDAAILQGIDIKNPKTYTRLAWLWLWKFEQNLARKPQDGIFEAMIGAGKEVATTAGFILLQQFVNVHGSARLKDLHASVQKKGLLGGKPPSPETEEGEGKKTGETEKPPEPGGHKPLPGFRQSIENLKARQAANPNECGEILDADGNLIHSQEGDSPSSIRWDFPPGKMKGGTMLHTHPTIPGKPGDPRVIGGPHSGADLAEAINNQLGESVVIGQDKVYRVKVNNPAIENSPSYRGNSRGKLALEIKQAYERALQDIKPEIVKQGNEQVARIRNEKGSVSPEEVTAIREKAALEWKEKAIGKVAGQFGEYISLETTPA